MWRVLGVYVTLLGVVGIAWADAATDCSQDRDRDRQIRGCTQYVQQNPNDKRNLALAYANRCAAYLARSDNDRSIADCTKATEIDPKNAAAYANRARGYLAKRDFDRAIADYATVIEINPKHLNAYIDRGIAYRAKGDYDRAIADFSVAVQIDKKRGQSYLERGRAYAFRASGNPTSEAHTNSIADFSVAIDLDRSAKSYTHRAHAYRWVGKLDEAIDDYNKALQIDKKYADAYSGRGVSYMGKILFDLALHDLNTAIELKPDANAYHMRSWAYHKAGRSLDALPDATKAIELHPTDWALWDVIGDIYVALGRERDAITAYRKALDLNPHLARVKEKLTRLGVAQ